MNRAISLFLAFLFLSSIASAKEITCLAKDQVMEFNETQVVQWLQDKSKKRLKTRAFIRGVIVSVIEDRQNHVHLEVDMDADLETQVDRIEVIYNTKFGALPTFAPMDSIVACGDFEKDRYSPFLGVVHWLHLNPKNTPHEDGFLMINGVLAGQEDPSK